MLGGLQSGTTYYLRSCNTVMEWNKPGYCVLGHSPAGIEWIQSVTVPSSAIDWGRRVPWGDVARYQTVSILSRRIPRYRISPSISRPTKHSDGRPAMSLTFCHISVIGMNAKVSKVSNRFFLVFHVSLYLFIHFVCLKLCICMQICCVNCQFYLLVLVVTTFVFIFRFLGRL